MSKLEQDLKSALIRRNVLEKELAETQAEVDDLQKSKRSLEIQLDDQKKQLRALNIELNTLRAEVDSRGNSRQVVEDRSDKRHSPYRVDLDSINQFQEESSRDTGLVVYNRRPELPRRENNVIGVVGM